MLEICWYCDEMIDVDEGVEGHPEIHLHCHLEVQSNGAWSEYLARHENLQRIKLAEAVAYIAGIQQRIDAMRASLL